MKYAFLLIILLACSGKPRPAEKKADDDIARNYDKKGNLVSEVTMKNGMRNGRARTYYSNGKVNLELTYVNNVKHGKGFRYYESGALYQESDYVNGKLNGEQKKFSEEGKLMSVAIYSDDEPCKGLKEFNDDGSERTNYPTIVFTPVNRLLTDRVYILKVSLSNRSKNAKYNRGKLMPGGCFDSRSLPLDVDQSGTCQIRYEIPPGQFFMEEVSVVADVKTVFGNRYITQKTYNIAVENR